MNVLERFAESRFMKYLESISMKLSGSPAFSAISNGMGGTMGLVMIGAIVQIICVVGTTFLGLDATGKLYQTLYRPYQWTMGAMALYMAFNMAYTYAKNLKLNGVQSGFTSLICYFLVSCPLMSVQVGETAMTVVNFDNFGATGLFTAIIIAMTTVRVTKFVTDHHWIIRMPDVVPEGILNSFNSIIPTAVNVIIWYGLAVILDTVTQGALTLSGAITYALSIPVSFMISTPGMFVILALMQFFWFFGIHGTSVIFTALMVPMMTAYMSNADLMAAGQPLVFHPVFLFGAVSIMGGTGNTLPICLLGLKSKSEQIRAISKASFIPGCFNINEPVIFGFPIMYNPILFIPFLLNPLIIAGLNLILWKLEIVALPSVLIMTTLPVLMSNFMGTLDWKNVVFAILCFPLLTIIWYPFFKIYEKQCIEKEKAEALEAQEV